jgi:hypothetical protein
MDPLALVRDRGTAESGSEIADFGSYLVEVI